MQMKLSFTAQCQAPAEWSLGLRLLLGTFGQWSGRYVITGK